MASSSHSLGLSRTKQTGYESGQTAHSPHVPVIPYVTFSLAGMKEEKIYSHGTIPSLEYGLTAGKMRRCGRKKPLSSEHAVGKWNMQHGVLIIRGARAARASFRKMTVENSTAKQRSQVEQCCISSACLGSQPFLQGSSWAIYITCSLQNEVGVRWGSQHPVSCSSSQPGSEWVQGQFWRGDTPLQDCSSSGL